MVCACAGASDAAAAAFGEVRSAVRKSGDQVGECYALLGLGEVHARRNDLTAAAGLLTAAESVARNLGERMLLGRVEMAWAEVLLRQGQPGAAAEYADQAIDDFDDVQAHLLKAATLAIRGEIHVAVGNPRAARESWESGLTTLASADDRVSHATAFELRRRISRLGSPAASSSGGRAVVGLFWRPLVAGLRARSVGAVPPRGCRTAIG